MAIIISYVSLPEGTPIAGWFSPSSSLNGPLRTVSSLARKATNGSSLRKAEILGAAERCHVPRVKSGGFAANKWGFNSFKWLVGATSPSEKYEFVNWDDYSTLYGKIKNVPNHRPVKMVWHGVNVASLEEVGWSEKVVWTPKKIQEVISDLSLCVLENNQHKILLDLVIPLLRLKVAK